jgi:hypothetical protein
VCIREVHARIDCHFAGHEIYRGPDSRGAGVHVAASVVRYAVAVVVFPVAGGLVVADLSTSAFGRILRTAGGAPALRVSSEGVAPSFFTPRATLFEPSGAVLIAGVRVILTAHAPMEIGFVRLEAKFQHEGEVVGLGIGTTGVVERVTAGAQVDETALRMRLRCGKHRNGAGGDRETVFHGLLRENSRTRIK